MKEVIFITGNQGKADYLSRWLGMPVAHQKIDLDELQSLDLSEIINHKARQAYEITKKPVLVEDVGLTFTAMGKLPGPFIKWFLQEIGIEGLCKMADGLPHRGAIASVMYGYCDGEQVHEFLMELPGTIADRPRGERGMGWDPIFIPEGHERTYAEMTIEELHPASVRAKAIDQLKVFLSAQQ